MKKQLMTTTALVAAGLLATSGAALAQKKASKPTLSLGGWVEGIVGAVDNDKTQAAHSGVDVQYDSEIHFKGSATLDNGIKIRTRTELEGQTGGGNQTGPHSVNVSTDIIDEAYIAVSGSFGEVRIGSDDNAPHLMVTPYMGHWATNAGQNTAFDVADWIEAPGGHAASSVNRLDLGDADQEKITYFTPRIEGFQVGVSYMPNLNGKLEGQNGTPDPRIGNFHEGYAVGAVFDRKFDQVGIGIGAGYAWAKPGVANHSDPEGYVLGAKVTFGGLTVAAGRHAEWNMSADTAAANSGDTSLDLGVMYKMGKNNFSIGYMHVEDEASRALTADDETDILLASYRRDLGPGVQYRLNFMWADYQGEVAGSADDNEGMAVTTSVRVAF